MPYFKALKRKWRKINCASWNRITSKGKKITKVGGGKKMILMFGVHMFVEIKELQACLKTEMKDA